MLNIATNDFWNEPAPVAAIEAAYGPFLDALLADYADARFYLMISPGLFSSRRTEQEKILRHLAAAHADRVRVLDLGSVQASEGWGCEYHPSRTTQSRLGAALADILRQDPGLAP